jgi:hypothetical protein
MVPLPPPPPPDEVTLTDACWLIAVPSIVAEIVFPSATLEVNELVNTPLPFVVPEAGVSVLPLPDDVRVTLAPAIVALLASRAVTVIVEDPVPAVNDVGDAVTVEFVAETPPPPPPPPEA